MVSKLFDKPKPKRAVSVIPVVDTVNNAGGVAYSFTDQHALVQLACTGTFNNTYYATGKSQFDKIIELAAGQSAKFLAKLAIYARKHGGMKDTPIALFLLASKKDPAIAAKAFNTVVNNGKQLRTLVQMVRSKKFGRSGLSRNLQTLCQNWLNKASDVDLLNASVGSDMSLSDVLRLARPTPPNESRSAFYAWLLGNDRLKADDLPLLVNQYDQYLKASDAKQAGLIPQMNLRHDLLIAQAKGPKALKALVYTMGPFALRMNLNMMCKHGLFNDAEVVDYVADRLSNEREVLASKQFPYQYFAAYVNAVDVPVKIKTALHTAASIACGNVPQLNLPLVIGCDVSGSMASPVTGKNGTSSSKMKYCDVAAVMSAAMLRANPESKLVTFNYSCQEQNVDPNDSILSIAKRLSMCGGGTDCSLPIEYALKLNKKLAGVVVVSDNESWYQNRNNSSKSANLWEEFVKQQRKFSNVPKLVLIDITPNDNSQVKSSSNVLNVGGFSDSVFNVVSSFFNDETTLVDVVEAVDLGQS